MNNLSTHELVTRTKSLVAEERRITLALIEHLEEIQRRIQAMRLVRDVPDAKEALAKGSLSLSNAAKVQSFRQAEKRQGRKHDAAALVAQVETLSQKECEAKLCEISPQAMSQESQRVVSAQMDRQVTVTLSQEFFEKLERLKGLLAHAKPSASLAELWEFATDLALKHVEKKKGLSDDADMVITAAAAVEKSDPKPPGVRIVLPVVTRRAVWARAQGRCQVKGCKSIYRLEIDHIVPLAVGGTNRLEILRLACWQHNHAEAVRVLGSHAMMRRASG